MFVTIYFPIFDMRAFFPVRTTKTRRPTWPVPLSGQPFQRNLGAIIDRPLGGIRGWAAESNICDIRASLVLNGAEWQPVRLPMRAAFKRFYADGDNGAQFSIGIVMPQGRGATWPELRSDIESILGARLRSPHRQDDVSVREAGRLVADLFAAGSSKGNRSIDVGTYIHHGRPLIFLQGGPLPHRRGGQPEGFRGEVDGQEYMICEISRDLGPQFPFPVFALDTSSGKPRLVLRTARIILARLYLELFSFERCLSLVMSPKVDELDAQGREAIRDRLGLAAQRLTGSAAPRVAQRLDVYDQLNRIFSTLHRPGRIDDLRNGLRQVGASLNLQRAVMSAAEKTEVISQASTGLGGKGDIYVTSYNNYGQVGAMGDHAQASNFTQAWANAGASIDLPALASELARLQDEMRSSANSSEELESLTAIARAKEAAEANDGPTALSYLAKAGKWAFGVAEKIGVAVAAAAIKVSLGI